MPKKIKEKNESNEDVDISVPIYNYDVGGNDKKPDHPLMPGHPFRLLMVGGSGSGKTNVLVNMLMNYLVYDRVYIYTKHMHQEKYQLLKNFYSSIEENPEVKKIIDPPLFVMKENIKDMVPLESMDPKIRNVIVFDDFVVDRKQDKMIDAFIRGRHSNASVIYLSQSYFSTPKDIRLNCSHFLFFNVASRNELSAISRDHVQEMTKENFIEIFEEAVREPYSFFFIDKFNKEKSLRFRKNFDEALVE